MVSVTALEAKTRFGKLLERVARGEEVVITKHEKPVARLIPEGKRDLRPVRNAAVRLRELQKKIKSRGGEGRLTIREIRSAVEEGRR